MCFMRHCFENSLAGCQDIVNYRKDGAAFVNRLGMLSMKWEKVHYLSFQNDVTDQYDSSASKIDLSPVTTPSARPDLSRRLPGAAPVDTAV
jgi:hypothetical protein